MLARVLMRRAVIREQHSGPGEGNSPEEQGTVKLLTAIYFLPAMTAQILN